MKSAPLILIPGLMCDVTVWQPVMPGLQAAPTVSAIHVADHGLSHSLTDMAQRILDAHAGPLHVAGHSMGGRVALEMARLAPERVLRLALLDTGHLPKPSGEAGEQERDKRMALLAIAQTQGLRAMAHQWVQGMVHPDRLSDAALMTSILDMFERKTPAHFEAQIEALLARPDASSVLRAWDGPLLIATGAQDTWANVAQHQAMQALAPQGRLVVWPECGHMAMQEQPEAVLQDLLRWLA
jgi:pimeloyl-ACP methyl ester carboxylesterase